MNETHEPDKPSAFLFGKEEHAAAVGARPARMWVAAAVVIALLYLPQLFGPLRLCYDTVALLVAKTFTLHDFGVVVKTDGNAAAA